MTVPLGQCSTLQPVNIEEVRNRTLGIDGYNVLVTLESALDEKLLILADDGLVRDITGKSSRYIKLRKYLLPLA